MSEQVPYAADDSQPLNAFDNADLLENPEPRCACVLVLDTSYSMHG